MHYSLYLEEEEKAQKAGPLLSILRRSRDWCTSLDIEKKKKKNRKLVHYSLILEEVESDALVQYSLFLEEVK